MALIKSLTIGLNIDEFALPIDIKKVNIGEVMIKYNFSIVDQSNDEKLSMIALELLENENVVIGHACYNLEEVLYLNNELKKYNLSLDTVYIPSEERIRARVQKAIEEQRRWGYREGVTDEEIERNFKDFKVTLLAIKDGLRKTNIKVIEA
jgi:hypothetical protein